MSPDQWQRIEELFEAALAEALTDRDACVQDTVTDTGTVGPLAGQNILHYQIVAKLGEGGMGVVYRALDTKLLRTVAIKLSTSALGDPHNNRNGRLIREARAASAVNHPNIANVYEIGEMDELQFIVMEYVEGQTLQDIMKERRFDCAQVLYIGAQIAEGLAEAHAHGVIHRDIKPANIMVNSKGQIKILDFGLAEVSRSNLDIPGSGEGSLAIPEPLIGTPAYMAPELVLGHSVDRRSDIFSIGTVLYEMAMGRPLFQGATTTETMDQILRRKLPPVLDLGPQFGPGFRRVLHNCLEEKPEDRYQTADKLARDLRLLRPAHAPGQLWRRILYSRRRAIEAATALFGVLQSAVRGLSRAADDRWNLRARRLAIR